MPTSPAESDQQRRAVRRDGTTHQQKGESAFARQGLGIPGKPSGMSGSLAPELWADGHHTEVLEYVAQDVRITLAVAEACQRQQAFRRVTSRGTRSTMPLPCGWLTVEQALQLPLPDTSWMDEPWPRQKFTGWLSDPVV